ncbi:hypothetical protein IFM47457_08346 [Aspergillus lentulus]|nr:hypothetical protein IFM47457_08346 [Aspergillus lentulus]
MSSQLHCQGKRGGSSKGINTGNSGMLQENVTRYMSNFRNLYEKEGFKVLSALLNVEILENLLKRFQNHSAVVLAERRSRSAKVI